MVFRSDEIIRIRYSVLTESSGYQCAHPNAAKYLLSAIIIFYFEDKYFSAAQDKNNKIKDGNDLQKKTS
jgi:hypothetical protein